MPADFLSQVQGNILLPYANTNCARVLLYRFGPDSLAELRAWVRALSERITYHAAPHASDAGRRGAPRVGAAARDQIPAARRFDRDARGGPAGDQHSVCTNVGFTFSGLGALGFDPYTLHYLPEAFQQGMRARADLLGDPAPRPGELPRIDAVVIVQAFDAKVRELALRVGRDTHAWMPLDTDAIQELELAVDLALHAAVAALPTSGAVTHLSDLDQDSYTLAADEGDPVGVGLEYFGFRDGISQPVVREVPRPGAAPGDGDASPGVVLLGWPGEGGAPRTRAELALEHLRFGSFLVLRKLSQDVAGFREQLQRAAAAIPGLGARELAEQMMGRRRDGEPLVPARSGSPNDFDYEGDRDGRRCPFQSHIRRANPRNRQSAFHRIMRRGMPYSTHRHRDRPVEQGLLFQAYNADIAAQFEFVQGAWLHAGSESRGASQDRDPIVAAPAPGGGQASSEAFESCFGFTFGGRAHAVRGLASYVAFKTGEYFLVPARHTLDELSRNADSPIREYERRIASSTAGLARDVLGRWLDDARCGLRIWREVRERGGCVRLDSRGEASVLVGAPELLEKVLRDDGSRYSVREQGRRMRETTGAFYLGMDACDPQYQLEHRASSLLIPGWKSNAWTDPGRCRLPPTVETALACEAGSSKANEDALDELHQRTEALCLAALATSLTVAVAEHSGPGLPERGELHVSAFAAFVLSGLCPHLFGVPQPSSQGAFLLNVPVSGYVFFPFPEEEFLEHVRDAAHGISTYLAKLFDERARRKAGTSLPLHPDWIDGRPPAQPPRLEWSERLDETLSALESIYEGRPYGRTWSRDDSVRTLTGIVSGMLIASFKLFRDGISMWARTAETNEKGELKLDPSIQPDRLPFEMHARRGLSMPNLLYRTSVDDHELGDVGVRAGDIVVACQGSAMAAEGGSRWFYGDRTPGREVDELAPHFCPGFRAADVILGTMSEFLVAGRVHLRLRRKDESGEVLEYEFAPAYQVLEIARRTAGRPD